MRLTQNDFRFVFWVAVLPALVSVAVLVFGVAEPERPHRLGVLILADLVLAAARSPWVAVLGVGLWGPPHGNDPGPCSVRSWRRPHPSPIAERHSASFTC